MRKLFPGTRWLLAAVTAAGFTGAAMAAEPVAGQDYEVLDNPVASDLPDDRISVTEVFWYGCPHCYDLEAPLESWAEDLPEDVGFERLPATMGGPSWMKHAAVFYAAQDVGIFSEAFHRDFFDAIHQDGQRLTDNDDIADFFAEYGADREETIASLDSFGVKSQLNQATARMKSYELMGVPALVVDGRYVITPQSAQGLSNMIEVADALVEKTRQEQQSDS